MLTRDDTSYEESGAMLKRLDRVKNPRIWEQCMLKRLQGILIDVWEGGGDEGGRRDSRTEKTEVHDSFPDLVDLVVKGYGVSVYEGVARISGEDRSDNPTLGELKKIGPK
ncbi:uncharacterized protein LOC102679901 [Apis dorsata]|uniref:uncharacterized protein LOC102679901 n=1 Tax=Apis dorsata TaxID=7462 RepID=UPI001293E23F|nr:uncharacterized protein LOC102679901 [Apis dorsata]